MHIIDLYINCVCNLDTSPSCDGAKFRSNFGTFKTNTNKTKFLLKKIV
jgi:hypothetical protein